MYRILKNWVYVSVAEKEKKVGLVRMPEVIFFQSSVFFIRATFYILAFMKSVDLKAVLFMRGNSSTTCAYA